MQVTIAKRLRAFYDSNGLSLFEMAVRIAPPEKWVPMSSAYSAYKDLADHPVRYDSFRRIVNQGKIPSCKRGGSRRVSMWGVVNHVATTELAGFPLDRIGPPEISESEAIWTLPGLSKCVCIERDETGWHSQVNFVPALDLLIGALWERDLALLFADEVAANRMP